MRVSVCTTNYNCAHVLERHLDSVFQNLAGHSFEYIVVDNRSRDGSLEVLRSYAEGRPNMVVLSHRCTMGEGRQIAFSQSHGDYVVVLDTDVVYSSLLRQFLDAYLQNCPGLSVQAIFGGIFPREQWISSGGRRSLNTNEDVDLWLRLCRLGTMRWYPVSLGENVKEAAAWGKADYLSSRYTRRERAFRLLRREWDLLKTRPVQQTNLDALIEPNIIDFRLGPRPGRWPQSREQISIVSRLVTFLREFKQVMNSP